MKRIPIVAAKHVAEQYGYDQVVIIARKVGDGGGEHVTTYGVDKANCDAAARIGTFLKSVVMKWPEALKTLADRFLMWPLPRSFSPDCGISFDRDYASQRPVNWPVGTNLLTADEARQMVEYLVDH